MESRGVTNAKAMEKRMTKWEEGENRAENNEERSSEDLGMASPMMRVEKQVRNVGRSSNHGTPRKGTHWLDERDYSGHQGTVHLDNWMT